MKMAAKAEPPKPKDIDATGTYSVSLAYGGQPVGVTLEIAKQADGSLGGAIYADQVPAVPLTSVTVTGNRVQASLVTPDGANATLDFTIEGAALKGKWSASNGDGSEISGTKLP
ncbi:MAG: hypothetical protein O2973_05510 [Gemmatimonadetes bacterium]|nr:hypothetical protein [Gemmatimonadota bacterium]